MFHAYVAFHAFTTCWQITSMEFKKQYFACTLVFATLVLVYIMHTSYNMRYNIIRQHETEKWALQDERYGLKRKSGDKLNDKSGLKSEEVYQRSKHGEQRYLKPVSYIIGFNASVKEAILVNFNATEKKAMVVTSNATEKKAMVATSDATEKKAMVVTPDATEKKAMVVTSNAAEKEAMVVTSNATEKMAMVVTSNATEKKAMVVGYNDALRNVASADGIVLLALVDQGFVDMAINFYLTCLRPHNIENYLILTMHKDTCTSMTEYKINCFKYRDFVEGNDRASNFGSKQFINKMNVRTDMIIEALELGYSVLHSDIDVTYMKNPFDYINCKKEECDMAALIDRTGLNAGFILIHPSAVIIYKQMKYLSQKYPGMADQDQLNAVAPKHQKKDPDFKIKRLSTKQFLCGKFYYPSRHFADTMSPCPQCVVVHNNWIVGVEAKVYRAKELHQWMNDRDQYYTSTTRLYLTYKHFTEPIKSLNAAFHLGRSLNRTLILPSFHGSNLLSVVSIDKFDKLHAGLYREHSFLTHPLVPLKVKNSKYLANISIERAAEGINVEAYSNISAYVLEFN